MNGVAIPPRRTKGQSVKLQKFNVTIPGDEKADRPEQTVSFYAVNAAHALSQLWDKWRYTQDAARLQKYVVRARVELAS